MRHVILALMLALAAPLVQASPAEDIARRLLDPGEKLDRATILRDTIGRTCTLHIQYRDTGWFVHHSRDRGVHQVCGCAVEAALRRGVGEEHLLPSFSPRHRMLGAEGAAIVRQQTERCARIEFPQDGPEFRPAGSTGNEDAPWMRPQAAAPARRPAATPLVVPAPPATAGAIDAARLKYCKVLADARPSLAGDIRRAGLTPGAFCDCVAEARTSDEFDDRLSSCLAP